MIQSKGNSFFIAGTQRSGTTLLAEILGRHCEIDIDLNSVGFRLISIVKYYKEILPYNLDHSWEELFAWLIEHDYKQRAAELLDYENISNYVSARDLVESGISKKLKESGKRVFGDKTPNMQFFVPDLLALIPDAKIVHIIRDGRATALSHANRTKKNLYLAAQEWVEGNIMALQNQAHIGKSQYHILKYEDLILNTQSTLTELCKFLDIPFDEALMIDDRDVTNKHYVLKGFNASKVDEWQNKLSEKQVTKIEKIQGPLLTRFGYFLVHEKNSFKPPSELKQILWRQSDNVKQLFRSYAFGMKSGKNEKVYQPIRKRINYFVLKLGKDIMSEKAYKRLFRRRWIKSVHFPDSINHNTKNSEN